MNKLVLSIAAVILFAGSGGCVRSAIKDAPWASPQYDRVMPDGDSPEFGPLFRKAEPPPAVVAPPDDPDADGPAEAA